MPSSTVLEEYNLGGAERAARHYLRDSMEGSMIEPDFAAENNHLASFTALGLSGATIEDVAGPKFHSMDASMAQVLAQSKGLAIERRWGLKSHSATTSGIDALSGMQETRFAVYSDGSKTEQNTAGFGYAVYRRQQLIAQGCGQIGKGEVFGAEIKGAAEGLRAAFAHQRQRKGSQIVSTTLLLLTE
ncbi:hypothetical protein MY4038_003010 [Beauveria bassiana]